MQTKVMNWGPMPETAEETINLSFQKDGKAFEGK